MTKYSVSVIIPVHNRGLMVCEAIKSVCNQSLLPDEIIVIDDGSTDDTKIRIKNLDTTGYTGLTCFSQSNQGVSSARNNGISMANCEFIAFLDSDDLWKKNKLKDQIDYLKNNPDILACHTDEEWYLNGKWLNQKKRHKKYGGNIYDKCLPLCIISPSSIILHRDIFTEIGLFNSSFPVCEDYDFWLRLSSRYEIGYLNKKAVIKRGGHDGQLSKSMQGMDYYRVLALKGMIESDYLPDEKKMITYNCLIEKAGILLTGYKKRNNQEKINEIENIIKSCKSIVFNI